MKMRCPKCDDHREVLVANEGEAMTYGIAKPCSACCDKLGRRKGKYRPPRKGYAPASSKFYHECRRVA